MGQSSSKEEKLCKHYREQYRNNNDGSVARTSMTRKSLGCPSPNSVLTRVNSQDYSHPPASTSCWALPRSTQLACWTASSYGSILASPPCAPLPFPIIEKIATQLRPQELPRRLLPASAAFEDILITHVLAAMQCAELAAMRLTCKAWCSGATQAVLDIPSWMRPEEACNPVGRWAEQAPYVRSICVLLPFGALLPQSEDPNAYQAKIESQLMARYPNLQKIHWQVDDILRLVNEKVSWVVTTHRPSWFFNKAGRQCEFLDVPACVMDSIICPEEEVKVVLHCSNGRALPSSMKLWEVRMCGPVSVRQLMEGIAKAGHTPADDDQKARLARKLVRSGTPANETERLVSKATRWDTTPEHRYFQDLTKAGGVYIMSLGS